VVLVEISGEAVRGAADRAGDLRRRYGLRAGRFAVLLIGKDGHVALRREGVISAAQLQGAIDAMPMRRAGLK